MHLNTPIGSVQRNIIVAYQNILTFIVKDTARFTKFMHLKYLSINIQ